MLPLNGNRYALRRQLLRLFGTGFGIYDEQGNLILQADETPFRFRREFHLRGLGVDPIGIYANSIADFGARYDVVDVKANMKVGALQRQWLRSLLRDEWTVMDAWDRPIGQVIEDSAGLAALRRLGLGLIPQNYDIVVNGQRMVDLRQNFNPFTYHLSIEFLVSPQFFDRRIGIAAAVLLGAVDGRQRSEARDLERLIDLPF